MDTRSYPSPNLSALLALGLQYLVIFLPLIIGPLLMLGLGSDIPDLIYNSVFSAMMAAAVATLLMCSRRWMGPGVFLPITGATPLFAIGLIVAQKGDFATLLGIGVVAGCLQVLLTPLMRWLKGVFDLRLAGFITMLLGLWVAQMGVVALFLPDQLTPFLFHNEQTQFSQIHGSSLMIGLLSLAVMLGCQIWGNGKVRMFSVLWGSAVGWIVALLFGLLNVKSVHLLKAAPWWFMWEPSKMVMPEFHFHYHLIPCLTAAIILALQAMSMLVMTHHELGRDKDFSGVMIRGNIRSGLGLIVSSFLGAPQAPNPAAIGVLSSSGIYARSLGYVCALFLVILAFSPKLSFLFMTIPAPVRGATILFLGSVMFMKGFRAMQFEIMSAFASTVFAFALLLGASMSIIPSFYHTHAVWLSSITNPVFFVAIVIYILLHLLVPKRFQLDRGLR